MRRWSMRMLRGMFFAVMMLGAIWIASTSLVYFEPDTLAPFVIERLPVRFEALWLASLQVHVASAILVLPLCLLLMTRFLQLRRVWHRWLGRIAGVFVLGALVPSGVVLSFEAEGGAWVTLGFLLSAGIVFAAMCVGVVSARRRNLVLHARAMRHVVLQMSVAVSSRGLLIAFHLMGMHPETAYAAALWLPVLGSALVAEQLSGRLLFLHSVFVHQTTRSLS